MTNPITATTIEFLSGWRTVQHGRIAPGGILAIEYDMERLPLSRRWFRDVLFGDIEAYVRFHPDGQIYTGSVVEKVYAPNGGPCRHLKPGRYEVIVPTGATEVEIWFRGFYQITEHYETWDSRYGQNYWFTVNK